MFDCQRLFVRVCTALVDLNFQEIITESTSKILKIKVMQFPSRHNPLSADSED